VDARVYVYVAPSTVVRLSQAPSHGHQPSLGATPGSPVPHAAGQPLPFRHQRKTAGRSTSPLGRFFCPWSRVGSWLARGGLIDHQKRTSESNFDSYDTSRSEAATAAKRSAGNGNRSRQGRCMAHCVEAVNLVLGVHS
jgi:hypothetical protein